MSHWSKDAIIERATDEIIEMPMDEILSFIYDKGSYSDEKHTNSLCEQIIDIAIDTMTEELMNQSPH
tara:strand:+ start:332 stop:532 length:201 start_codon:yes stop_codon:yes gene_type:complete